VIDETRKRRCEPSRRCAVDPERQLVLIFPGGHPQQNRPAAAVQERRLHHGDQGAGPDSAVACRAATPRCRKGSKIIRPATVSIRIGEPIETAGLALTDRDALIAKTRQRIEGLLALGPV
jgi:hypothetical protein